jgi:23S rRNA (pseudouridine1915-N3)-methyltransferase
VNILILRVSKGRCRWSDQGVEEYLQRLGRQLPVQEILLKPANPKLSLEERRASETKQILQRLKPDDRLVVLDERGEVATTEAVCSWVQESMNSGVKRLIFAIGGPFGHHEVIRTKAWKNLALSRMVLNHELARLTLCEQLYRIHTLIYGGNYHH